MINFVEYLNAWFISDLVLKVLDNRRFYITISGGRRLRVNSSYNYTRSELYYLPSWGHDLFLHSRGLVTLVEERGGSFRVPGNVYIVTINFP